MGAAQRAPVAADAEAVLASMIMGSENQDQAKSARIVTELADERFHELVDAVTDYAIFLLDERGYVQSWSRGAERLKGYSAEEVIGCHFSIFYVPEDRAAGRPERVLETVRREGRYEEEGHRVRKNGSRFWANVVITPLLSADGSVRGFAKVTRDLSERRAAAEALRQSEERFRMLIEGVNDCAIYMLDPRGVVTTWNVGAQRLTGYRAAEIIGQPFAKFFREEDIAAGRPERELSTARDEGRFEDEGWRVRKDGTHFWASAALSPLRTSDGELLGFAKVTRDLTRQKQSEELERDLIREQVARALAEANERKLIENEETARRAALRAEEAAHRAEEASRAKDEFLATVSHELRTPLNAIVGWSTILKNAEAPPTFQKGLEAIHRNAEAQARIIDDILDVSRIVSGKLRLDVKATDLVTVASEAIDVLRASAVAKGVHVQLVTDPNLPRLLADHERLRQVLWNLLSNAIKFSKAKDRVVIRVEARDSSIEIIVSDTGAGIEPAFLPFVFERFRQADGATTRRFGGLGLGLAIVRHIVELHGGEVSAESEGLGHGARFRVVLPARADVLAEAAAAEPEPRKSTHALEGRATLHGTRVLIVDDDDDACELLERALRELGAQVSTASSAYSALEALQRMRPHVLVSDIGMPLEDGYALIRKVRSLPAHQGGNVPAIALTAYTRPQDRALALAAGFTTHLTKPVNVEELAVAIASLSALGK